MCRTIADRGEGRASMKLGSEIIGMMERIQVRSARQKMYYLFAASALLMDCADASSMRVRSRHKTFEWPSGQEGQTRLFVFISMIPTLNLYTLNHKVKPNDLLAKAYIELGSAATVAGADPSFCLREGWRLLEVARKGPGAINDGTYTCMMDACSKSASMGNR
jgi:hypothetical protein